MSVALDKAKAAFLSDMEDQNNAMTEEEIQGFMDVLDMPEKIELMKYIADYYTDVLEPSLKGVATKAATGTKH